MDAALIQRVNSKLTDLAELQSREAATTTPSPAKKKVAKKTKGKKTKTCE